MLAFVVVVLVVLGVVSATTAHGAPTPTAIPIGEVSLASESSAFYCGGLEHVAGKVESYVAVADLGEPPRIVEISTTNERQQVILRQVKVLPGHVFHFTPDRLLAGSFEAASVDANEGGIAVTESIRGVNGVAVAPCVSSTSPSWWTTGGSTGPGQGYVLSLFNPSASDAVVSVTLYTSKGIDSPSVPEPALGPAPAGQCSACTPSRRTSRRSRRTSRRPPASSSTASGARPRPARRPSLLPGTPNAPMDSYLPSASGTRT